MLFRSVLWAGSLCVAAIIYLLVHFEYINETGTYGNRMLPPLIAAAGFMSVIIGTASTLNLSASRRLDTKLIFVLDVISTLAGICAMLICAWWTRSIWSLIAGSVASTCCGVALSHVYMAGPKNRLRLDRAAIAEIVGFGKWVALSSSITVFVVNSDRLILGALITPHELGLYSIALSLVGALSLVIGQLVDKVMLPAFSQVALRNKDDLPAAYFKMRLYLDPAVLFMSGLLFGIGPLLVSFLYDVRYSQAGNVLSLLALGMVMDRFYLSQQVYMIIGRPQYLAPINAIRLASILCLVPLGFYIDGFYGAVIAVALRDLPVLPLIFWFNSRHHLNRIKTELYLLLCWPVGYFFAFILNSFSISK